MLHLIWSAKAYEDLERLTDYIAQFNLRAAESLWQQIYESTTQLPHHPYLYRISERKAGCRELIVHPNYIVVYRVTADAIQILRVLHARQQFP